ncbi:MAG: hypothetical protein WC315_06160 [Candidatus Omnitrophota bacterium]|jgi:hypothetical protein
MNKKVFGGRYTLEQLRQNIVLLQAKDVELPRKWLIQLILLAQKGEANQTEIARLHEALRQVQHDIDGAECRDDLDGIKGHIDEAIEGRDGE